MSFLSLAMVDLRGFEPRTFPITSGRAPSDAEGFSHVGGIFQRLICCSRRRLSERLSNDSE